MMTMKLDWLAAIPFPVVATTLAGVIEEYNVDFTQLFESASINKGTSLNSIFDMWEDQGDSLVFARRKDTCYTLVHKIVQSQLIYIVASGSPIDRLKNQISQLDKLNAELDTIIDNSYDVIYITDSNGVTLRTNTAIERVTGIPKGYYIGKNVTKLVDRGILKESVTLKVLEQKKPVTVVQENFSGKITMMTGSPIMNEHGEIEKIVTNIRDLSELNQLHLELKRARELNDQYRKELERFKSKPRHDPDVILKSEEMKRIYDMSERIANVDATVLILGETGVGKDVLAGYIYRSSDRHNKGELVKVNCGAIPEQLLESELFGYEAGAFTGASRSGKPGMFELADKGVLFLDEVGELPLPLQVKLLNVLQEKKIQRVGAIKSKHVDVRVIAATNRNLKEMVKQGLFREDLYYRLNVLPISVPSLKERKCDIFPLVDYFLGKMNEKYQISKHFDEKLLSFFYHYHWTGNVRELANLIERLVLTVPSTLITLDDLPLEYQEREGSLVAYANVITLKEAAELAEREILSLAVKKFDSTYKMAEELGTSQATIVRKLKKYNL